MNRRAYGSLSAVLAFWIFFFWGTLVSLVYNRQSLIFSLLGFFIIVAALYVIYSRLKTLQEVVFISSQFGLLVLFALVVVWTLAGVVGLPFMQKVTFILMLPAIVLTTCGPHVVRALAFPLLYLLLLIPLWDISFPFRNLIPWFAFGLMVGYLRYQSLLYRVIYTLFAVAIGIIATWRHWHWAISVIMMGILFGIGLFIREKGTIPSASKMRVDDHKSEDIHRIMTQSSRWLVPTTIACCMIMVSPWLSENIRDFYPVFHRSVNLVAPAGQGHWIGPQQTVFTDWQPLFKNASSSLQVQYVETPSFLPVYLYAAYYQSDRSIDELFVAENAVYDPKIWQEIESSKRIVPSVRGLVVLESVLESQGVSRVQWSWYFVSGIASIDLRFLKFMDTVRLIAKHADGPGVIVVSTAYDGDPNEARVRLESFLKDMVIGLGIIERPEKNLNQHRYRLL